ncbi:hypothetical protein ABT143_06685 [Streptomyces sp. NPDC002033]|uniref:hypothetical protein n=1 Tax=unclassified Streptomyces TaxID=2593676 RepID=UPI00332589A1
MHAQPNDDVPDHAPGSAAPTANTRSRPAGAGKTSTADLLGDLPADAGAPHAVIYLDRLCQAWPPPADDPFQLGLFLANLRPVTANYRAAGVHPLYWRASPRTPPNATPSGPPLACRCGYAAAVLHTTQWPRPTASATADRT